MSGKHHITPISTYLKVFVALLFLTFITVWIAQFDFGHLNAFIAMLVATVKAVLVMTWFMHLKYDTVLNRVIFGSAFLFLLIMVFFSGLDIFTRLPQGSTL